MSKFLRSKYQIFVYVPLIIYLLMNIGLFSDEFTLLLQMQNKSLLEALRLDRDFIHSPLSQYLFNFFLFFIKNGQLMIITILKIFYPLLSIYLISKFFNLFLTEFNSVLVAFFFVFYPIHDSVTYFFLAQQMLFNFAFYCYAFYLASNNRFVLAFIFSFLGSFVFYGSPPIALSLFVLFLLNKDIKKGLIIYIPNLIFIVYFLTVAKIFKLGAASKLPEVFEITAFIKYFILQVLTFIDAMLGPSMWMKAYYSFYQLSFMSWIIGCLIIVLLYLSIGKSFCANQTTPQKIISNDKHFKLIISFIIMLLASFGMFAITGKYPQMAFNFGNRTTIYGAFIVSYLIAVIPSAKNKLIIYSLMILVILGISDHWKRWAVYQQKVIEEIRNNKSLGHYYDKKIIYVSGNQYSKYGPMSHIEFLSEDWVADSVFKLALGRNINAKSLNRRHKYKDGYLIDAKYNLRTNLNDYVNIYDSEKGILLKLKAEEVNSYIESLPPDKRHWIQMVNIKFINDFINKLMPRLRYAL